LEESKTYAVVIDEPAERDLWEILRYITDTLKEPETAKRVYRSIKERIMSLDRFPFRHKIVDDARYAALGLRKLYAENYTAFYVIDEARDTVHILRILYNRREWQNLL
jgi:toxin ParE1/3/4